MDPFPSPFRRLPPGRVLPLLALPLLAVGTVSAHGQVLDPLPEPDSTEVGFEGNRWTVGLPLGMGIFLSNARTPLGENPNEELSFDPAPIVGGEGSYRVSSRVSFTGYFLWTSPDGELSLANRDVIDFDIFYWGADVRYSAGRPQSFDPFATVGLGAKSYDFDETDFVFSVGAGFTLPVQGPWGVRFLANDHISVFDRFEDETGQFPDATLHDLLATVAVTYRL